MSAPGGSLPAPDGSVGATCNLGPSGGDPAGTSPTAERFERAARVLRAGRAAIDAERAEEIIHTDYGDKPWQAEECEDGCACIVSQGDYAPLGKTQDPPIQYIADAQTPALAAWIALAHPGIGEHLAALCEDVAELVAANPELERPHVDGGPCDDLACRITHHLRGIAAAITPEETP